MARKRKKRIDLVEANPTGINEMKELFQQQGISQNQFQIYECTIEEFDNKKYYDIIIAEGFIHAISNAKQIIYKLCSMLKPNGIIVITCMDECGVFVEEIKRLVIDVITKNMNNYKEKVKFIQNFLSLNFPNYRGCPEA